MVSSTALFAELAGVVSRAKFDAILARSNISRERSPGRDAGTGLTLQAVIGSRGIRR